jgi:hypothetical protein
VLPRGDQGPGLLLEVGGSTEAYLKPFGDQWVKVICEESMRSVPSGLLHGMFQLLSLTSKRQAGRSLLFVPRFSSRRMPGILQPLYQEAPTI